MSTCYHQFHQENQLNHRNIIFLNISLEKNPEIYEYPRTRFQWTKYSKASTYPEITGRVSDSPCEVAASIRLELVSWLDGVDA